MEDEQVLLPGCSPLQDEERSTEDDEDNEEDQTANEGFVVVCVRHL